jgi:predicted enzyme related to lactoylglutathione lyase
VAGLVYETLGGAWFRLYRTPYAGTAQHTVAGWEVEDIEAEVAELKARGVAFEESQSGQFQTVDGIASAQGSRVAWFKDSEGNILGLAQRR